MCLIITCYNCRQLLLTRVRQKTKSCTYCGAKLQVDRATVVAQERSVRKASMVLRALKKEEKKSSIDSRLS